VGGATRLPRFPATGFRPDPPGSPPALKTYFFDPVGRALVTNRGGQTIAFFSYRDMGSSVPGPKNMRRRS